MVGFEENEISKNANGGTELSKRSIAATLPEELLGNFQIIASRVRDLDESKIRVYWHHDLPEDPEVSHLSNSSSRDKFHKFVFVSNWQLNEFNLKLNFPLNDKSIVIENPIAPFKLEPKPTDRINLVYFSTPQRGLEILVPVFEKLAEKYNNIHLDVFSSFKIYGWPEADVQFEPLYQRVKDHPKMTYHGYADQETLRGHLTKSHILAYPNIWKETSCRVLIESMSAGLMCVHPNYGALPETSAGLTSMYQFDEDKKQHAAKFYQYLEHAINVVTTENAQNYLRFVKTYADTRFDLGKISSQWKGLLEDLNENYPTVESRAYPRQQFVYKTS
jgi:UDP-glucose:(glucosyl)LPS alpha-1,2-glucosyltransferase